MSPGFFEGPARNTGSPEQELNRALELAQARLAETLEGGPEAHAEAVGLAGELTGVEKGDEAFWEKQEKLIELVSAHYIGESVLEGLEGIVRNLPAAERVKFYEQAPFPVLVMDEGERYEDTSSESRKIFLRGATFDAVQNAPSFDSSRYQELSRLMLRTRLLRAIAREPWTKGHGPSEALGKNAEDYLMALKPIIEPTVSRSRPYERKQEVVVMYGSGVAGRNVFPQDAATCLRLVFEADPSLFTDAATLAVLRDRIGGLEQDRIIGGHADFRRFLREGDGISVEDGIPYRNQDELMRIRGLLERERRNLEE